MQTPFPASSELSRGPWSCNRECWGKIASTVVNAHSKTRASRTLALLRHNRHDTSAAHSPREKARKTFSACQNTAADSGQPRLASHYIDARRCSLFLSQQQMQTCDFFAILCEGGGQGSFNIRSIHVEGGCTVRLLLLFLIKEGHPFSGLVRHGKIRLQQCR